MRKICQPVPVQKFLVTYERHRSNVHFDRDPDFLQISTTQPQKAEQHSEKQIYYVSQCDNRIVAYNFLRCMIVLLGCEILNASVL